MSSILTNIGAVSALQTLKAISSQMHQAQRQISTGLRVSTAADDASYWSIATTMRSDHIMLTATKDALAIGTARVDVAYRGMESVISVLDRVKQKLITAAQPGPDKAIIQQELARLADEAAVIAQSSSFNGVNWLNTNVSTHLREFTNIDTVAVGATLSGSINFDLRAVSLFNAGGGGALQKELVPLGSIGGFRGTDALATGHYGHEDHVFTDPATFGASDQITFDLIIDQSTYSAGRTYRITINKALIDAALGTTDGVIGSAIELRHVLERAFKDGNIPARTYPHGTSLEIFEIGTLEKTGHAGSSIAINVLSSDFGSSALSLGIPPQYVNHDNIYSQVTVDFAEPLFVTGKTAFYFDVRVGSERLSTVRVDAGTIDAALGTSDGYIGSASDFAKVLNHAARGHGIAVTASGNQIIFGADQMIYPQAGNKAPTLYVGNVRDDVDEYSLPFDLTEIDITQQKYSLQDYLKGVDYMLERVTSGASILGSLRTRIEMEADFTSVLSDNVALGIGQFVDADMDEVSTRFQALQVQQNLAIQALSIANANAEIIIQIFK